jgi:putative FmdB family regulatory protein
MPIYEYECKGCGEVFEVLQKLSDPAPKKHTCGSTKVRRVMSPSAFVFKGEGWYVTDYARKDQEKKNKKKGGSEGGESGSSSGSSGSSGGSGGSSSSGGNKASAA